MTSPILLDTHVLLWSLLEPSEISRGTKQQITLAQNNNRLLLSSISLWEIAMLNLKKRINIYEPTKEFLKSVASVRDLSVKDISPDVAAESVLLMDDFHGDPADRIIVATAKIYGATLLTRDKKILDWAKSGHIHCVKV
jgi:PIN domain nuclease of toxin-antitoxin system